jgi:hypothetical protein
MCAASWPALRDSCGQWGAPAPTTTRPQCPRQHTHHARKTIEKVKSQRERGTKVGERHAQREKEHRYGISSHLAVTEAEVRRKAKSGTENDRVKCLTMLQRNTTAPTNAHHGFSHHFWCCGIFIPRTRPSNICICIPQMIDFTSEPRLLRAAWQSGDCDCDCLGRSGNPTIAIAIV